MVRMTPQSRRNLTAALGFAHLPPRAPELRLLHWHRRRQADADHRRLHLSGHAKRHAGGARGWPWELHDHHPQVPRPAGEGVARHPRGG